MDGADMSEDLASSSSVREDNVYTRLNVRPLPPSEVLYGCIPKHKARVPPGPNVLPEWKERAMDAKLPRVPVPRGAVVYAREKLAKPLMFISPLHDFDLSDPYMYKTKLPTIYEPLHDRHLKSYFKVPLVKEILMKNEVVTEDGHVICSLKQFNDFRAYLNKNYRDAILHERNLRDERERCEKKQLEMIRAAERDAAGADRARMRADKAHQSKIRYQRKQLRVIQRANEARMEEERIRERKAQEALMEKLQVNSLREQERAMKQETLRLAAQERCRWRNATAATIRKKAEMVQNRLEMRRMDLDYEREEARGLYLEAKRKMQEDSMDHAKTITENRENQRRANIDEYEKFLAETRKRDKAHWSTGRPVQVEETPDLSKKQQTKIKQEAKFETAWDINDSLRQTLKMLKRRFMQDKLQQEAMEKAEEESRRRRRESDLSAEAASRRRVREEVLRLIALNPNVYQAVEGVVGEIAEQARDELVTAKALELAKSVMGIIRERSTLLLKEKLCAAHSVCLTEDGDTSGRTCVCGDIVFEIEEAKDPKHPQMARLMGEFLGEVSTILSNKLIKESKRELETGSRREISPAGIESIVSQISEMVVREAIHGVESRHKPKKAVLPSSSTESVGKRKKKKKKKKSEEEEDEDEEEEESSSRRTSEAGATEGPSELSRTSSKRKKKGKKSKKKVGSKTSSSEEDLSVGEDAERRESAGSGEAAQGKAAAAKKGKEGGAEGEAEGGEGEEEEPCLAPCSTVGGKTAAGKAKGAPMTPAEKQSAKRRAEIVDWAARALVDHVMESLREELQELHELCKTGEHGNVPMKDPPVDIVALALAMIERVLKKADLDMTLPLSDTSKNKLLQANIAGTLVQFLDDLRWQKQDDEPETPAKKVKVDPTAKIDGAPAVPLKQKSVTGLKPKGVPTRQVRSDGQLPLNLPYDLTATGTLSLTADELVLDALHAQTCKLLAEHEDEEMDKLMNEAPERIGSEGVSPVASDLVDRILDIQARRLTQESVVFTLSDLDIEKLLAQKEEEIMGEAFVSGSDAALRKAVAEEMNHIAPEATSRVAPGLVRAQGARVSVDTRDQIDRTALVKKLLEHMTEEGVDTERSQEAAQSLLDSVLESYRDSLIRNARQSLARKEILQVLLDSGLGTSVCPKNLAVVAALLLVEAARMQMQSLLMAASSPGTTDELMNLDRQKICDSLAKAIDSVTKSAPKVPEGLQAVAPGLVESVLRAHARSVLCGAERMLQRQDGRNAAAVMVAMSGIAQPRPAPPVDLNSIQALAELMLDEILHLQTDFLLKDIQVDMADNEVMSEAVAEALKEEEEAPADAAVKVFLDLQSEGLKETHPAYLDDTLVNSVAAALKTARKASDPREIILVAAGMITEAHFRDHARDELQKFLDNPSMPPELSKVAKEKLADTPEKFGFKDTADKVAKSLAAAQRNLMFPNAKTYLECKEELGALAAKKLKELVDGGKEDAKNVVGTVVATLKDAEGAVKASRAARKPKSKPAAPCVGSQPKKVVEEEEEAGPSSQEPGVPSKSPPGGKGAGKKKPPTKSGSREKIPGAAAQPKRSVSMATANAIQVDSTISMSRSADAILGENLSMEAAQLVRLTLMAAAQRLTTAAPPGPSQDMAPSSGESTTDSRQIRSVTGSAMNVVATTMVDYLLRDIQQEEHRLQDVQPHLCYCGGAYDGTGPCGNQCYCPLPAPDLIPHYNGKPLEIDPDVVSRGLRAISIQHLSKEGIAGSSGGTPGGQLEPSGSIPMPLADHPSQTCVPPHELVDRNSFANLLKPEVSHLEQMKGLSPEAIQQVLLDHASRDEDWQAPLDARDSREEREQSTVDLNESESPVEDEVVQMVHDALNEANQGGEQGYDEQSQIASARVSKRPSEGVLKEDEKEDYGPLWFRNELSSGLGLKEKSKEDLDRRMSSVDDMDAVVAIQDEVLTLVGDETDQEVEEATLGDSRYTSTASIASGGEQRQSADLSSSQLFGTAYRSPRQSFNAFDTRRSISGPYIDDNVQDRCFASSMSAATPTTSIEVTPTPSENAALAAVSLAKPASGILDEENPRTSSAPVTESGSWATARFTHAESEAALSLPGDLSGEKLVGAPEKQADGDSSGTHSTDSPRSVDSSTAARRSLSKSLSDLLDRIKSFVSDIGSSSSSKASVLTKASSNENGEQ